MPTPQFKSFAVMDIETTNLPYMGVNSVSITEISFYGFLASELLGRETYVGEIPELPRVLHKLTLAVKPRKNIGDMALKLTGMKHKLLKNESRFDDNVAEAIVGFVDHLPQPVCLVAQHGNVIDFPVLKASMARVGVLFRESTLCLDSASAFRQILANDPRGKSMRLHKLYVRHFGETVASGLYDSLHAEDDVHALTQLMLYHGESFLQYANANAVPFSRVRI